MDQIPISNAVLTADTCLTAQFHTFLEIDHEINSTVNLPPPPPSADSRRVVVSNKQKYEHEVLFNCLVKLEQETIWLGELTIPTWPSRHDHSYSLGILIAN